MTKYEDQFGDTVDTEKLYKCPKCNWVGKVSEMKEDFDCSDDDAVLAEYCCPRCWEWIPFITRWKTVLD